MLISIIYYNIMNNNNYNFKLQELSKSYNIFKLNYSVY